MTKIKALLVPLMKEIYCRKPPKIIWNNQTYEFIKDLSIDQRGQVGEELTAKILKKKGCRVIYNPNKASREKDWDIISNDCKIEIKLATIGKNGKMFQHEHLERNRKFDALMLIDVTPDKIYLSCYDFDELDWKKMHRRSNNGLYKFDISLKKLTEDDCFVETIDDFFAKYKIMENKTLKRLGKKPPEHKL